MDNPIPQSITKPLLHDPFGMITFGRNWEAGSEYRYGFNTQEQDDEVYGNGNALDFGARIYNTSIGKFFSIDPLNKKFPNFSPFLFANNSPIFAIDFGGFAAWIATRDWTREDLFEFQSFVKTEIEKINAATLSGEISKNTCFDCADLAVHLIIQYAYENGLPLEFTDVNGNSISNNDDRYSTVEQFEDRVRGMTSAKSLLENDMEQISGDPISGDMTNTGGHVDVVRPIEAEYDDDLDQSRIPTISGTTPRCCEVDGSFSDVTIEPYYGVLISKKDRYSNVSKSRTFYRWEELNNATSDLPVEPIETYSPTLESDFSEPQIKLK